MGGHIIMQVKSTTTHNPRRASARARKAGRPNAVKPARSAKRSLPPALAEIDLIRAYQAGDARAGNALLQTHATLIQETARPYFRGFHRDDVLQEARCGFLQGVVRFDEAAGVKLATYAVHWIRHSAEVYLAEHGSPIRVPDHAQRTTANEHAQGLGQQAKRCGRLDAPLGDEDSQTRGDLLGDEDVQTLSDLLPDGRETPETVAAIASQRALYRRLMAPLLESLSPLEREILLRCVMVEKGSEETHAAVGAKIGVSRKRVEQMLYAVLEKLRRRLAMVGVKAVEDVDEVDRETFARVQCLPRVRKNDGG
jgi:RNA polymerase sigma-32 factor